MKKCCKKIFPLILLSLVLVQCAKRGRPTGGPEDLTPPNFVRSSPENYSTNFDAEEIRIYFDEYVRLDKAQEQIIISPPMNPRPNITPLGTARKDIRISNLDSLLPNTTYVINFGRSIVDNNADNPLPFFKYVFSTGNEIDSLTLSGTIKDAKLKEPENFVSVFLYEVDSTFNDSAVYKRTPRYIANTLDSTNFQFSNLKAGKYQLVAVTDKNNNYKFDPASEKIGFKKEFIQIPTNSSFTLSLFKENPPLAFNPPSQIAGQHLVFGYRGRIFTDSLKISAQEVPQTFEASFFKDKKSDSLHYFYKPPLQRDSLNFVVAQNLYSDTLSIRRLTEKVRDSIIYEVTPSERLHFSDSLLVTANIPFSVADESLITLRDKDSANIPISLKYDGFQNKLHIDFSKKENELYTLNIFPGALKGFFETKNDSIIKSLRTKSFTDYGNLTINLQNIPKTQVIVQITNTKGIVQDEITATGQNIFNFENINPGKYFLRIIIDENQNNQWDTGNFLTNRLPEPIIYYPDQIDVRPNWDVEQTFILK